MDIEKVLEERGKRYGTFSGHAGLSQNLKFIMRVHPNWGALTDAQKESLDMIQHKIARIINGDANYADSWDDIAGYAKLITRIIEGNEL